MNKLASGVLGAVPGGVNKAGTAGAKSAGRAGKEGVQNKAAESEFGNTRAGQLFLGGKRKANARQSKLRNERASEAAVEHAKYRSDIAAPLAAFEANREAGYLAAGYTADRAAKQAKADRKVEERKYADRLVAKTGNSKTAQFALMAQAAQAGDLRVLESLQSKMEPEVWNEGVNANYSAFDKVAPWRAQDDAGRQAEVSKLTYPALIDLSQGAQAEISENPALAGSISAQVFVDAHKDTANRAKVSEKIRKERVEWATRNPGHPDAAKINSVLDANGNWR